jgi:hypothetical protein
MRPERKDTTTLLIDIGYKSSLNKFEEIYGENVSYKEVEQRSYVEFKELLFELIDKDIKFRKFGRIGQNLTIKSEMLVSEIEKLKELLKFDKINLTTDWTVKEITIIKKQEENLN